MSPLEDSQGNRSSSGDHGRNRQSHKSSRSPDHHEDARQQVGSSARMQINHLDEKIKQEEADRTKKLASRKDSRQVSEMAKRLKLDVNKDQDRLMDEFRKKSRAQYLKSRAAKQIELLEEDIKDEKALFSDVNLSKKERDRQEFNEKVLQLTKDHIESDKRYKVKHYSLPDDKDLEDVDLEEDEVEALPDQSRWEKGKFDAAHILSKPRDSKEHELQFSDDLDEYELLKDDIEFLERVKRGDTFEEYRVDSRKADIQAKELARKQMQETRKKLPVYERKEELLQAIDENQIIIVQGETGCGKTTQIPQYLHEAGYTKIEMKHGETKMVGCTQPRRVAAMSVAARVSQEIGSKLGHTVGYSIRFEDCTSEGTVIKYMTDGMLLRELLDDPTLSKYSVMIVDEAHERTLHTDILLTLLKHVAKDRADFRLIISSATLDERKFSQFFNNPPVFKIKGRLFKVENLFMAPNQKVSTGNMIDSCRRTVMHIHKTDQPGDILVFLPGQEEIEDLQKEIESEVKKQGSKIKELIIRPIYANLPTDMQAKVFIKTPPNARKVVIATNIAETSLTIDGIVYVVDPGYCKQNKFSPRTGMETLAITRISKASADQRSGRAGRNRPGKCFRLYTREEFNTEFEENTQPEIQRLNLANVVLLLKTMNIGDVLNFEFIDRPPRDVLLFAIEQLIALGALTRPHKADEPASSSDASESAYPGLVSELTPLGRKMAEFPLDPKMSKAIISSEANECSEEILSIMSMLSIGGSIFFKPKDRAVHAEASRKSFFSVTGDHMMLLKVYDDWASSNFSKQWCWEKFVQYKSMCRARDIRDQLENLCDKVEIKLSSNPTDSTSIIKAILSGFFYNVARISRDGGSYRTIKENQPVHIHPTSGLHGAHPRWVVFNELKLTTKEYMRVVSEIETGWLTEAAPWLKETVDELAKKKMPKINKGKSRAELNPRYT